MKPKKKLLVQDKQLLKEENNNNRINNKSQLQLMFMWLEQIRPLAIQMLLRLHYHHHHHHNKTIPFQNQNHYNLLLMTIPAQKKLLCKRQGQISLILGFLWREVIQRFQLLFTWCLTPILWVSNIKMNNTRTKFIRFSTRYSPNWWIQNPAELSVSWMLTPSRGGINLKMTQSKNKWSNWSQKVDLISR